MTTKLLAVDDSKTMRKVLEITFAGDTFDSTIVGSAEEALAALRAGPPQIAVVDGALGAVSGYDLCKQIKEAAPGVKVLLLSSKQRPYDAAQGSAAGVDDYFDKPFDSGKFLDKLSAMEVSAAAPQVTSAPQVAAAPQVSSVPKIAAAPPPAVSAPPVIRPVTAAATPAPEPQPVVQRPQAPPSRVPSSAPTAQARPMALSAATSGITLDMRGKLEALGLTSDQVKGVLSLSRDVVEQVVWEVVPVLAETLIKEEIARLTSE